MMRQAPDPDDPDRFMDLQLQHAAQLADKARKERDLSKRVDQARTVISLIRAALATYVPDGHSSDAFRLTIDGAFLKLGALHIAIKDTAYADTLQTVMGEMKTKFIADGWTPPENTGAAETRAMAAEEAGVTVLDAEEQVRLAELHLRMARDQLTRKNLHHGEKELQKARSLLGQERSSHSSSAIRIPSATLADLEAVEQLYANLLSSRSRG